MNNVYLLLVFGNNWKKVRDVQMFYQQLRGKFCFFCVFVRKFSEIKN